MTISGNVYNSSNSKIVGFRGLMIRILNSKYEKYFMHDLLTSC